MSPEHFYERSQDMVSMQDAKDMARMAFMSGKVCAAAELEGMAHLDPVIVAEAQQWQRFYDYEMEKSQRNANVHPLFRGLLNDIGGGL